MEPGNFAYQCSNLLLAAFIGLLLVALGSAWAHSNVPHYVFAFICAGVFAAFLGLRMAMKRTPLISGMWGILWTLVAMIIAVVMVLITQGTSPY